MHVLKIQVMSYSRGWSVAVALTKSKEDISLMSFSRDKGKVCSLIRLLLLVLFADVSMRSANSCLLTLAT